MRAAVKKHSRLTKAALMGQGWDRHLFALRTLAERQAGNARQGGGEEPQGGGDLPRLFASDAYATLAKVGSTPYSFPTQPPIAHFPHPLPPPLLPPTPTPYSPPYPPLPPPTSPYLPPRKDHPFDFDALIEGARRRWLRSGESGVLRNRLRDPRGGVRRARDELRTRCRRLCQRTRGVHQGYARGEQPEARRQMREQSGRATF